MTSLDVLAVGHAIVDRISFVDDSVLVAGGLAKGSMRLVGAPEDLVLDGAGAPRWQRAAGSAGNTAAALAMLGSSVAFVGRVGDDDLGAAYAEDLAALGVELHPARAVPGGATGQCLVLVTPDGERTMATYLGAGTALQPGDLPADLVGRARILYAEGYLWDSPGAVAAVAEALDGGGASASGGGGAAPAPGPAAGTTGPAPGTTTGPTTGTTTGRPTFALSLSDPFCVERHRDAYRDLVVSQVGVLFANEAEIFSLTGLTGLDKVVAELRGWRCVVAVTRGAAGSVVVRGNQVAAVDAVPVAEVLDTTGAGDLYAAGFLHAYLRGGGLEDCARLGSVAAAEVISHVGARPVVSLRSLAGSAGLAEAAAPDPSPTSRGTSPTSRGPAPGPARGPATRTTDKEQT